MGTRIVKRCEIWMNAQVAICGFNSYPASMRGMAVLISSAGIGLLTTAAGLVWRANTVAALGLCLLFLAGFLTLRGAAGAPAAITPQPGNLPLPADEKGRALESLRRAIISARDAGWSGVTRESAILDAALTATLSVYGMPGWRLSVESIMPERTHLKIAIRYAETIYPYLEQGQVARAQAKGLEYLRSVVD